MLSLSLAFCHHYSLSFCTAIHYNRLPIRARTLTDSSDANSSIGISWTKYETDVLWCTRCLQWGLLAWSIRPSRIKMHPKPCFHTTVVICCWMSQNYQTMHSFSVFFTGNNNNVTIKFNSVKLMQKRGLMVKGKKKNIFQMLRLWKRQLTDLEGSSVCTFSLLIAGGFQDSWLRENIFSAWLPTLRHSPMGFCLMWEQQTAQMCGGVKIIYLALVGVSWRVFCINERY